MNRPAHEVLEAARGHVSMSFDDLWLAYFALGGAGTPAVVRSYLDGAWTTVFDYDVLAHALNERYCERGDNHPVPYREDLV